MSGRARILLINVALAVVYFAGARLGLSLATVHISASAVWPPTGIAIAAVLLFGFRVGPGIFAGAFAANLIDLSIVPAGFIAFGNTMEAIVGGWLVIRFADGKRAFERPAMVFRYIGLAAISATTISATIGVCALFLTGADDGKPFLALWRTWWLGDMVSALVMAPLIIAWATLRPPRVRAGDVLEMAAIAALLLATGIIVFWVEREIALRHPLSFVCIPPVVWAAFRFGLHGAVTSALMMQVVAVTGTMQGRGIFVLEDKDLAFFLLQLFIGIVAFTALVLASAVAERRRIEGLLAGHRDHLERALDARTAELEASHARLRLADRAQALGSLAAGLGHDMGNLLMPLAIRLEALERMELNDPAREHLRAIRASAEYLRQLNTGLRLLARDPSRGAATEPTDLSAWWKEASVLLRNVVPRGIALKSELERSDLIALMSAPALTQVILNLIQNAGDAMRGRGQGAITLAARHDESAGRVLFIVADDGPGMTCEMRERCMQPFVSSKSGEGSIGLGLAIVYDLVTRAGGSIQVDSEIGKGTTFTLSIPGHPRRDRAIHDTLQAHSGL